MFIADPKKILEFVESTGVPGEREAHYLFALARQSSLFFIENRDACPSQQDYLEVAEFLTETTTVVIDGGKAREILALYPHARIKVALYGLDDTDVRGDLCFVAAHFFVGCSWPTNDDRVDLDDFLHVLQRQAQLMGFSLNEG